MLMLRLCVFIRTRKDTVLPLLWPIRATDGTEIREVYIRKNTLVYASILGANRSKSIWGEDADEWKPERWLKPLPKSVSEAHLPGVYSQMYVYPMMRSLSDLNTCVFTG